MHDHSQLTGKWIWHLDDSKSKVPVLTFNRLITFLISKNMPPNLTTLPKRYLVTFWNDISWPKQLQVSMANV